MAHGWGMAKGWEEIPEEIREPLREVAIASPGSRDFREAVQNIVEYMESEHTCVAKIDGKNCRMISKIDSQYCEDH